MGPLYIEFLYYIYVWPWYYETLDLLHLYYADILGCCCACIINRHNNHPKVSHVSYLFMNYIKKIPISFCADMHMCPIRSTFMFSTMHQLSQTAAPLLLIMWLVITPVIGNVSRLLTASMRGKKKVWSREEQPRLFSVMARWDVDLSSDHHDGGSKMLLCNKRYEQPCW